jgi:purine-binding chemotaxis protein CheW
MASPAKKPSRAAIAKRKLHAVSGPRVEYLAFTLAGEAYAAPISLVRKIVKPPPLTPVPRAPDATLGIVIVRGQLVTVIDLRRRLRLPEAQPTRRTRILLVEATWGEMLGLYVDEVQQVYRLSEAEIEHAATALGGDVAGYVTGIARPVQQEEEGPAHPPVIVLLDLQAILAS